MRANVFRDVDPLASGATTVNRERGRSSWVEITNDSTRAERTLAIVREYAERMDDPDRAATVWRASTSAGSDDAPEGDVSGWVDEERIAGDASLAELSRQPRFTPSTTPARVTNPEEVEGLVDGLFPPALRAEGDSYGVQTWILIDTEGTVVAATISRPSAYAALDRAALEVAKGMRFTPAENRQGVVPVWVRKEIACRSVARTESRERSIRTGVIPLDRRADRPSSPTPSVGGSVDGDVPCRRRTDPWRLRDGTIPVPAAPAANTSAVSWRPRVAPCGKPT